MVKSLTYGTETAANKVIGGVPTIYYFDFQSRGRGQVVRLMLIDAGAAYKDVRYSFEEWPEVKHSEKVAQANPTTNLPFIEIGGKYLTQTYAILRHWARQLGGYDGKTENEKYFVDQITDIVIDWRTLFISAFFSENQREDYQKHCQGDRPRFLKAIETHLKSSDLASTGPYVIGNEFTYADMVLFQILHDEDLIQKEGKELDKFPRLVQLVEAVQNRPNIKKFFESNAYFG